MYKGCSDVYQGSFNALAVDCERIRDMDRDTLHSLFDYRDGDLFWRVSLSNRVKIGDKAGFVNKLGYTEVRIHKKLYLLHRLVYMYHFGDFCGNVDHKDNNPRNNSIDNLRLCTQSGNGCNKKMQRNNKSGYKGVAFCKQTGKWKGSIVREGKNYWLGRFSNKAEAVEAVKQARNSIHKEFANHG